MNDERHYLAVTHTRVLVTNRQMQGDGMSHEQPHPATNLMAARLELKQGAVVPIHSHLNEQICHVLKGALHFLIDGAPLVLHAGELLCIPPNMPHEARALEDTVAMDIFNPPRQDWLNKGDAYLRHDPGGKGLKQPQKLNGYPMFD